MLTQNRKIAELEPHPEQEAIYGAPTDQDYGTLKLDIEQNGIRQPIEITPDGTVIDGHQRLRIWSELGHTTIEVVVIEGLSSDEVTLRFYSSNLARRQVDFVAKARAYKAIAELEHKLQGRNGRLPKQDMREIIAKQFGVSARTGDRYLQLTRIPRCVQDAVTQDDLPLTKAIKVDTLSASKQQVLVQRVADGESVRSVVLEMTTPKKPPQAAPVVVDPVEHYCGICELVFENMSELEDSIELVTGSLGTSQYIVEGLNRAQDLFQKAAGIKRAELDKLPPKKATKKACQRPH